MQESGLKDLIKDPTLKTLPHLNPTQKQEAMEVSRAKKHFRTVTKEQLQELHFKFRVDFQLFDYSIEPYLSYAKE